MSRARRRDLVVVGGGSAGLVGALTAARLGARVTLVERERTGGECLWTGCVPSKSLLAAAELAHRMRTASAVGLEPVQPRIDFARVMGHVRDAQARIEPHDSPERLRGEGVEVVTGHARFVEPGRLAVDGRDVAYRAALVATGSRPALPPVEGLGGEALLTTDTVWSLDALPERLVVLGGGPVGCELAQAFARLGSRVALVEMGDGLLPAEEPEAGALLAQRLRDEGVDVRVGVRAERLEDGHLVLAGRTGAPERLPADRVLVATGRRPATDDMGLEAIGVRTGEDGAVQVDDRLSTTARGVYAAGDVTGLLPFT
ncbi:MAG TPA: FAD-dependent oxidoreductase, partial [Solirubrobacteraceae bacterium]|nr:FAD-dependent oxidoreductase [Solirubrobacteraceae bacterium]